MDERTQTRKRRLQELIERKARGNQADFAKKAGLSKGRITQLLSPDDSFGERSARKLAGALGLAEDYFESQHEPPPGAWRAESVRLAEALDTLSEALEKSDRDTLIAVAPLLATMASDPANAKNKSDLILKLLVTEGDKPALPEHDGKRQSHIFGDLGVLDLGDGNGRRDSDAAAGGKKK
ncbi:transcriptional regulator [Variovorax paradoxus]|uniref:helix-turn-helix domain-containing protein n=1 Tax=Variovorax paradoxus TaxID=34073 RepID=UPI000488B1CF